MVPQYVIFQIISLVTLTCRFLHELLVLLTIYKVSFIGRFFFHTLKNTHPVKFLGSNPKLCL